MVGARAAALLEPAGQSTGSESTGCASSGSGETSGSEGDILGGLGGGAADVAGGGEFSSMDYDYMAA